MWNVSREASSAPTSPLLLSSAGVRSGCIDGSEILVSVSFCRGSLHHYYPTVYFIKEWAVLRLSLLPLGFAGLPDSVQAFNSTPTVGDHLLNAGTIIRITRLLYDVWNSGDRPPCIWAH